jgi:hypothetical protein
VEQDLLDYKSFKIDNSYLADAEIQPLNAINHCINYNVKIQCKTIYLAYLDNHRISKINKQGVTIHQFVLQLIYLYILYTSKRKFAHFYIK